MVYDVDHRFAEGQRKPFPISIPGSDRILQRRIVLKTEELKDAEWTSGQRSDKSRRVG